MESAEGGAEDGGFASLAWPRQRHVLPCFKLETWAFGMDRLDLALLLLIASIAWCLHRTVRL